MFQQLPMILDDEDVQGERVRVQCLKNIRVSAAKRWHKICALPPESKRDDLWQQMDAFLTALRIHFEPVSFFKPPVVSDSSEQSPEKPASSRTCCSPTPSTSTADSLGGECSSNFQWRFLEFNGNVWATLKALL